MTACVFVPYVHPYHQPPAAVDPHCQVNPELVSPYSLPHPHASLYSLPHPHYQVNPELVSALEGQGLLFSGKDETQQRMEVREGGERGERGTKEG